MKDYIRCIDFFIDKVAATKNSGFSKKSSHSKLSIKRNVKHSFQFPGKKGNSFRITVKDRVTFGKVRGPFNLEITIGGVVYLKDEMTPSQLKKLMKVEANVEFLINQSLPYSCSLVAYLTDRMGFSPIILAPKTP